MRPVHIPLALACALIWGFVFVVIRWGLDEMPPLFFTGMRFVCAALFVPLVGFRPPVAWKYLIGIGICLGVFQFGFLFLGMDAGMPVGLASLVIQSQAFFTVILAAVLLRERPSPRRILGITLAFVGLAVMATGLPGGGSRIGLMLCVIAGMSWAVANMITKAANAPNALALMVWMSVVPPLPLFGLSLVFEGTRGFEALTTLSGLGWFAIAYNGIAATLIGFGLWSFLLKRYEASVVAPFSLLVPVFGMSFAALLLGESLTPVKLMAGAVIMVGLILTVMPARRPLRPVPGDAGTP